MHTGGVLGPAWKGEQWALGCPPHHPELPGWVPKASSGCDPHVDVGAGASQEPLARWVVLGLHLESICATPGGYLWVFLTVIWGGSCVHVCACLCSGSVCVSVCVVCVWCVCVGGSMWCV